MRSGHYCALHTFNSLPSLQALMRFPPPSSPTPFKLFTVTFHYFYISFKLLHVPFTFTSQSFYISFRVPSRLYSNSFNYSSTFLSPIPPPQWVRHIPPSHPLHIPSCRFTARQAQVTFGCGTDPQPGPHDPRVHLTTSTLGVTISTNR